MFNHCSFHTCILACKNVLIFFSFFWVRCSYICIYVNNNHEQSVIFLKSKSILFTADMILKSFTGWNMYDIECVPHVGFSERDKEIGLMALCLVCCHGFMCRGSSSSICGHHPLSPACCSLPIPASSQPLFPTIGPLTAMSVSISVDGSC